MRSLVKRVTTGAIRSVLEPGLCRWVQPPGNAKGGVSVHTLVSEKTWRMGVLAVSSFEFFSGMSWPVWVHDDGSLTAPTQRRIVQWRPHWRVVLRSESDGVAREKLRAFPRFLGLRERHPLAVKMADAWLWAPASKYIFIDSDCLFFQCPEFIMRWAASDDGTCWFMREYEGVYSYALPPEILDKWAGIEVMRRVNTGIGLLQKALFDWERIEKLLNAPEVASLERKADWYIEQTLSAVLLTVWGRGGLLPGKDYITGYDARLTDRGGRCTACHYVGPTKQDRYYYHGLTRLALRYVAHRVGSGTGKSE